MQFDEFPAMNTTVQVAAEGELTQLLPGFLQVRRFVENSEQRFSRFRETSELMQLNRSQGHWFRSSPELFELVREAKHLFELTGGTFDPSVLLALKQMGYDRSMDEIRERDLPAAPESAWNRPHFEELRLDDESCAIYLPHGVEIDLGGIAKGWIAERASELLLQYTEACAVSAGGDMALRGLPDLAHAWEISLEDPREADQVLAVLHIQPGGLATSTVTRRRWMQAGQSRHHIIDPRTGRPATSPWLSVTVHHRSPVVAEVAAKALLIGGPAETPEFLSKIGGLHYLAIDSEGSLESTFEDLERSYVTDQIR